MDSGTNRGIGDREARTEEALSKERRDVETGSERAEQISPLISFESSLSRYGCQLEEPVRLRSAYNEDSDVISTRQILVDSADGTSASQRVSHNILVVSDLHLGDSLRPSDPGYLKHLARLNRALSRFLRHYATHRVNGKPWRLVIAGDMIDFLHAGLFLHSDLAPTAVDAAKAAGEKHRESRSNSSEAVAIDWLERVMVRERRVFHLLAAFVGAGHQLVVIKGNHDAEFHFEGVQKRFSELLLELHIRRLLVRRRNKEDAADLAQEMCSFTSRISFCRWFYYERDLVYIEHGNQYDSFCSFEDVLSPIYADHFELEDPISHRTYREFASLLGSLDVHLIDQWKLTDYARWVLSLGPKMIGRLAYTYFASIAWLMRTKKRLLAAARKARDDHARGRALLTRHFGLSEEILTALDSLRERPAGSSVFAGINMLYMDRVLLGVLAVVVLFSAAVTDGSLWLRGGIAAGTVLLTGIGNHLLDRLRDQGPHPKLMRTARKLARLMKVPFVVLGHTHIPVMAKTTAHDATGDLPVTTDAPESWYFNTGSWTSSGKSGLTHVCILHDPEKPKAELRRWCPDSNRPLKLELEPDAVTG